jgi:hypothetical protein
MSSAAIKDLIVREYDNCIHLIDWVEGLCEDFPEHPVKQCDDACLFFIERDYGNN